MKTPISVTLMTILIVIYVLAALFAYGVLVIGTYGLFGTEPEALSAVYVILVGLPWSMMLGSLSDTTSLSVARIVMLLAPLVNLLILVVIRRLLRRWAQSRQD